MDRGERFKKFVKARMKAADFAREMHVQSQNVNSWFNRGLPGGRIYAAADVLGCSVEDLEPMVSTAVQSKKSAPLSERSYDMKSLSEEDLILLANAALEELRRRR